VVQAAQKTAGPLGTAIMGSVLAVSYQARLGLHGIPPAAAAAARQGVYGGVAAASRLESAALARSVRAAFASGMDVSLLVSAGIAVAGALLAMAFLPRRITMTDSGTSPARPGLRERKKAQTRATIQACAVRLFREQGYNATTIEQIIAAADVSETTFFRYFPTKEDLVLSGDYDPLLIEAFRAQPPHLAPVPALRAAFAATFGDLTAEQRAEQKERITLTFTVPRLRAAMLDQLSQAMQLLARAMAERAGRRPDDFTVRTVAGAVVGAAMAAGAAVTDNPDADLADLIDQAIAHLEPGLTL
jgi:AcrR family transcriptional regulator